MQGRLNVTGVAIGLFGKPGCFNCARHALRTALTSALSSRGFPVGVAQVHQRDGWRRASQREHRVKRAAITKQM